MKMASIVVPNNGVLAPVMLELGFLRAPPVPIPPITHPRWVPSLQFTASSSRSHLLFSAGGYNNGRWFYRAIACTRKTQQEESSSISEGETASAPSRNDINDVKKSHNISSDGNSQREAQRPENYVSSVRTVALCVFSAVAFGVALGFKDGVDKASEFLAGYLLEQSLSVDNLFVFVLIFKYFKVPLMYQNRVLSYGIAGAIFFRLSLILLGTATLQRFEVVNLLLAAILLYSAFKLFAEEEEDSDLSDNFIVKTCQKFIPVTSNYDGNRFLTIQDGAWKATPLLLTIAVIELSDIAFAVDSIPAVFGVTRDPFIVFTSNLFAILGTFLILAVSGSAIKYLHSGLLCTEIHLYLDDMKFCPKYSLRSLYSLISESMAELDYLQPAIGVVLSFIGFKMILDFFGYHVSTEVSLGFVATSLSAGVLLSLLKKTG